MIANNFIKLIIIFIFAILSTVFTIIGPKILGNAITELSNGFIGKITNTGGINFNKIETMLLGLLILYIIILILQLIMHYFLKI